MTGDTVRRWRWRRNPLRRRSDLAEAWAGLVAGLLMAIVAPLVGAATTVSVAEETLRQGGELDRTPAVLTEPAPQVTELTTAEGSAADGADGRVMATVRFTAPDGETRTDEAPVRPGSDEGARTVVWLDDEGRPHEEPPTRSEAWTGATMTGIAAASLVCLGLVATRWSVQARLDAARAERWEREWAEFGPQWSRHHA